MLRRRAATPNGAFFWLAMLFFLGSGLMSASGAGVQRWTISEIELNAARAHPNPYRDVTVSAVFAGPDGRTVQREAFWDGGTTWRLRFAPTAVGRWTWRTSCSDAADTGLDGRTGALECIRYEGNTSSYQHGFLRISKDERHFVHADGTPFFWLGDTHWQMPGTERVDACNHPAHDGGPCPHGGQFQHLVADRKEKGFTVYQTYPSATNPAWWAEPYDRIDPERFRRVFDVQMNYLAERGFVVALGFGHFNNSTKVPPEDLCRWARYLVARYGAHPVLWITCQEMNAPEADGRNRIAVWRRVAAQVSAVDGYDHPLSAHQWVVDVNTRPLGGESWHDWFALQGGHRGSGLTPRSRYAGYYYFEPTRPMIETEAMYERVDCGGVADTDDARISAWKAMLCGSAGHTYGAAGVWALKWDPADTRWQRYNHDIPAWYAGMALPGSRQMGVMKDFFLEVPWTGLTPRFGDSEWSSWEDPERCVLATVGNRLYLAYCYGPTSEGTLKKLGRGAVYAARWLDPRTGRYAGNSRDVRAPDGTWQVPRKPDDRDWLLVLERRRAGR